MKADLSSELSSYALMRRGSAAFCFGQVASDLAETCVSSVLVNGGYDSIAPESTAMFAISPALGFHLSFSYGHLQQ
jgi:hypothetical protein